MFSYVPHTPPKIILTPRLIWKVLHSQLITGYSGEACTTEPPLIEALVALGGIANEHQLVAV